MSPTSGRLGETPAPGPSTDAEAVPAVVPSADAAGRPAVAAVAALCAGCAAAQSAAPIDPVQASVLVLALLCAALAALLAAALAVIVRLRRSARRDADRLAQRDSERRALLDVLDVWLWRSDAHHRLVSLRPPADSGESVPAIADDARLLWQQFADTDGDRLQGRAQDQQPVISAQVERRSADGNGLRGLLQGSRLTAADGGFDGYFGVVRPAPSEVPATAAPSPSNDDEHSAFGYTISHDLRAPIRVVDGFARILKEDYGGLLDRIGNDHLDRLLSAAARMNAMIDALFDLSRLANQPLVRQPVDLSQLAGFVADDLRRQQPERRVELHIAPGLRAVGDPTLLRVLLENLLGNAWKYTARRETAEIRFVAHPHEPGVYTLSDNGAGFDMRHADRLFSMFQRLHGASEFEGTGIGLASVRRIVRRHGGQIRAEAEPGRGASFHFSLSPG